MILNNLLNTKALPSKKITHEIHTCIRQRDIKIRSAAMNTLYSTWWKYTAILYCGVTRGWIGRTFLLKRE